MPSWKKVITSGSDAALNSINVTNGLTLTGSLNHFGDYNHTGSVYHSGSKFLTGIFSQTGSLSITGSTTQIGNNTLLGTTTLSGSIIISGSTTVPATPTIKLYGDMETDGVIKFMPVVKNIDTTISASYIYVSGSTNDLYFSQNGVGYNNVTRLRWLESNLYTGLLHGGLITTQSSTVYQIASGSGMIVNLNASTANDPYPTVQFLQWPNLSSSIAPLSASFDQTFVAINSSATITTQSIPFNDGQFNTSIPIGLVLHQNHSTINGVKTSPTVAYGWKQRSSDFIRAFGPLKISGYAVLPSGSATGSLTVGSGTAFVDGANYAVDPNNPSYAVDNGTTVSKIFRYYQSGSNWVYNTNNGAGYEALDPVYYNPGGLGVLNTVGASNYSLQRVFWYPNSVTKAITVYYGNERYGTLALAQAGLASEAFNEAPNTTANAVYLGAFAIKGGTNTTLQNSAHFTWIPAGLFRGSGGGGGGGGGSTTPGGSSTQIQYNNGGAFGGVPTLTYNGTTLTATGSFTGSFIGSLLGTASFATTALSASYAPSTPTFPYTGSAEITGSLGVTGSFSVRTYDAFISNAFVNAIQITDTNRTIYDIFGNTSIDAGGRILTDMNALPSANWMARTLFDSSPSPSINWGFRYLYNSSGSISLNWETGILTGSLFGTASYATQALSASYTTQALSASYATTALSSSYAPAGNPFPYNGNAQISGSFGVTGSFVAITVDDVAFTRKLHDSQTGSGSLDFGNRDLLDSTGNGVFNWTGVAATIDARLYLNQAIDTTTRNALITNTNYGGFSLSEVLFDSGVQTNDLVYLNTDGKWYQVNQTTNTSTKMLGICQGYNPMTYLGFVRTEGDIIISTGPGYPLVQGANYGLPVYIRESGGTLMSTTIPTSGYVRLLGHCYHNAGGLEWIMKFRPSNDWYVI